MNFTKKEMINILKEEYEKRVDHFINLSEIEVRDKNDNDLIAAAMGLKVKDKAGFVYTVYTVIKDTAGQIFIRLLSPGEGLVDDFRSPSMSPILEDESDKEINIRKSAEIRPKNKNADVKRSFNPDMSKETAEEKYIKSDIYIDVPIKEFEANFSL